MRIELLRILGAGSVFAYHFMADAGAILHPAIASSGTWQLAWPAAGTFGVSLFIALSGLVFTWAWPRTLTAWAFIRRRVMALFPVYWWVAVPLVALALFAHRMPFSDLWKVPLWLTGLGILSPVTFVPVVDAWWYMSLALQFALLYPLLRQVQAWVGNEAFVVLAAIITIATHYAVRGPRLGYLAVGLAPARLLEFALGMTIGCYIAAGQRRWPRPLMLVAITGSVLMSVALVPTYLARIAAPLLILLVVGVAPNPSGPIAKPIALAGALSYTFYLCHSPWAKPILRALAHLPLPRWTDIIAGGVVSLAVAGAVTLGFRASFEFVRQKRKRRGEYG